MISDAIVCKCVQVSLNDPFSYILVFRRPKVQSSDRPLNAAPKSNRQNFPRKRLINQIMYTLRLCSRVYGTDGCLPHVNWPDLIFFENLVAKFPLLAVVPIPRCAPMSPKLSRHLSRKLKPDRRDKWSEIRRNPALCVSPTRPFGSGLRGSGLLGICRTSRCLLRNRTPADSGFLRRHTRNLS